MACRPEPLEAGEAVVVRGKQLFSRRTCRNMVRPRLSPAALSFTRHVVQTDEREHAFACEECGGGLEWPFASVSPVQSNQCLTDVWWLAAQASAGRQCCVWPFNMVYPSSCMEKIRELAQRHAGEKLQRGLWQASVHRMEGKVQCQRGNARFIEQIIV